jgi:hypothetical protein
LQNLTPLFRHYELSPLPLGKLANSKNNLPIYLAIANLQPLLRYLMAKQEHTQIFAKAITAAGYRLAWRNH